MQLRNIFKFVITIGTVILIPVFTNAQDNIGMATGNYAGISGLWMNPANAVDSRYKFDINIIGLSSYYTNNYLLVKNTALIRRLFNKSPYNSSFDAVKKDILQEGIVNGKVYARTVNNVQFPLSFLVTTGKRSAIAITMANRTINKVDSLNPETAKLFYDELRNPSLYNKTMNNDKLQQNFLNWQEVGFTYGRVIIGKGALFLKAAVTAKWLGAGAGGFIQADKLALSFKDSATVSINSPLVKYGRTATADLGQFQRKNIFNIIEDQALGIDAGVVFEVRARLKKFKYTDEDNNTLVRRDKNKYIFRLGISVVDLGEFNFKRKPLTNDHNAAFSNWNFASVKANNLSEFDTAYSKLINYIPGSPATFTYRLPAAVIVNFDLHLFGGFYVNVAAKQPLSAYGNKADTYIASDRWAVVTPRFETKFFGLYVPVTRIYNRTNIGATVKFGPFYAGSTNLSELLSNKNTYEADFHAGVRLSILHGKPPRILKSFDRLTNEATVSEKDNRKAIDSLYNEVRRLKTLQQETPVQKPVTIIINNAEGKAEVVKQTGDSVVINTANGSAKNTPSVNKNDTTANYFIKQLEASQRELKKLQDELADQKKGKKSATKKAKPDTKLIDRNKELEEENEKLKRQNNIKSAAIVTGATVAVVSSADKKEQKDTAVIIVDSVKNTTDTLHKKQIFPEGKIITDTIIIRDTVYIIKPTEPAIINKEIIVTDAPLPVFEPIYFATGVTALKITDINNISKVAAILKKEPALKIHLTGITDATGSVEVNKKIAIKRANAVRKILLGNGISNSRIEVETETGSHEGKSSVASRRVDMIVFK